MKTNIFINTITVLLSFTAILGCNQEFLDENPPHLLTADLLYTDLNGFESGLNGLYSMVRKEKGDADWGDVYSMASYFLCGTDLFTGRLC